MGGHLFNRAGGKIKKLRYFLPSFSGQTFGADVIVFSVTNIWNADSPETIGEFFNERLGANFSVGSKIG
jgi:hypothetical protein